MARVAFIGAGDITLLHAEAVARCPGAELAGLWNITPELAEEKSRRFGCPVYPSAEALVGDPAVDAVFVLTNLDTHCHYACLALEAGKHVLVEKPVAATLEELERMRAAAEERGLVLMPGHNYIHEDGVARTRELLDRGQLGDLVSVHIFYNIFHPEEVAARYPGVVRHILTHHAYLLLYLAGVPVRLSALKGVVHYEDFTGEDIAMVNLQMASGALAHFTASFAADDNAADPWTFLIKVIGTGGATRYSYRDWVENKPGVVHSHTFSAYPHALYNEVRFFVQRCLGAGDPPPSTIDDAILCHRIIEACETSVREGRTVELG